MGPCWGQHPYSDEATEATFILQESIRIHTRGESEVTHYITAPTFLGSLEMETAINKLTPGDVLGWVSKRTVPTTMQPFVLLTELGGWCRSLRIWPHSLLWARQRLGHKALQETFLLPLNCFSSCSPLSSQALAAAVTSQIAVCCLEMAVLFHFRFIDRSSLRRHG